MKIDTSQPRIPLNRLKHPLKSASQKESENECVDKKTASMEDFERKIIRQGAKRFEKWLDDIENQRDK